jgi:hypothetical protein
VFFAFSALVAASAEKPHRKRKRDATGALILSGDAEKSVFVGPDDTGTVGEISAVKDDDNSLNVVKYFPDGARSGVNWWIVAARSRSFPEFRSYQISSSVNVRSVGLEPTVCANSRRGCV